LNPVAVYAVAYLIQRTILMATLFVVLGLWLVARGFRTRQWWLHALALLCYGSPSPRRSTRSWRPFARSRSMSSVARPARKRLAIVAAATLVLVAIAGLILKQRVGIVLGRRSTSSRMCTSRSSPRWTASAPQRAWTPQHREPGVAFLRVRVSLVRAVSDWMSISLRPPFPVHWLTFPQVLGIPLYLAPSWALRALVADA
jgi:hypothetical protein